MAGRRKNTITNILFAGISFGSKFLCNLIIRYAIIKYLAVEYLGLSSLFSNILAILSLAEAGFGSAIVYSMYKPMAEENYPKVNALLKLYKKYYTIIASVILVFGVILIPFLPKIIKNSTGLNINIYYLYCIYLVNNILTYFYAHRRAVLYTTQRADIESKCTTIISLFLSITQIVVIFFTKNYYFYVTLIPIFSLLDILLIVLITNKKFKYLGKEQSILTKEEIRDINKNTFAMFFHKIGGIVLTSTDSLVIASILGLEILGLYSNYLLVIGGIASIVAIFTNSIKASVGNLIAKENIEYVKKMYFNLDFIFNWLVSFLGVCFFCLIQPFIKIWLGSECLLPTVTIILLSIHIYTYNSRNFNYTFKEATGLFWQNRYAPIFEVIINLIISILCTYKWGINGVILGTIVSSILVPFWLDRFIVCKFYFHGEYLKVYSKVFYYALIYSLSLIISYYTCKIVPYEGIQSIILKLALCFGVSNIIYVLSYFWTKEFKWCCGTLLSFLKRKTSQGKNDQGN